MLLIDWWKARGEQIYLPASVPVAGQNPVPHGPVLSKPTGSCLLNKDYFKQSQIAPIIIIQWAFEPFACRQETKCCMRNHCRFGLCGAAGALGSLEVGEWGEHPSFTLCSDNWIESPQGESLDPSPGSVFSAEVTLEQLKGQPKKLQSIMKLWR